MDGPVTDPCPPMTADGAGGLFGELSGDVLMTSSTTVGAPKVGVWDVLLVDLPKIFPNGFAAG